MNKIRLFFLSLLIAFSVGGLLVQDTPKVFAQSSTTTTCDSKKTFFGIPAWYKYLELSPAPTGGCAVNFEGTGGFSKAVVPIVFALIEMLLRVAALVSIGFIIAGGVKFISAQGQPDKATDARKTAINAVIGLVIAIASGAIVQFIAGRF